MQTGATWPQLAGVTNVGFRVVLRDTKGLSVGSVFLLSKQTPLKSVAAWGVDGK